MKKTVNETTIKNHLCVSCGICGAICPEACITFKRSRGQYIPQIDIQHCNNCGICSDICCKQTSPNTATQNLDNYIKGNFLFCYNAYALDEDIRKHSSSGGCITAIVKQMLNQGIYTCAFLVEDFNYNNYVSTKPFFKDDLLFNTSESRYIPISHQNMVKFILKNPQSRVIVVATGCVLQKLINVINKYNLQRNNYLFLGLFCAKTLNYNVFDYFKYFSKKSDLVELHFRTKEQIGWPGNIKLKYSNGNYTFIASKERIIIKEFFQLKHCLYCLDKLNRLSDIAFGDNYTKENADKAGSNSIIIRTELGNEIFNQVKNELELFKIDFEAIKKGQGIKNLKLNFVFANILYNEREINLYPELIQKKAINKKFIRDLNSKIKNINLGEEFPNKKIEIKTKIINKKILIILKRFKRKAIHILKSVKRELIGLGCR